MTIQPPMQVMSTQGKAPPIFSAYADTGGDPAMNSCELTASITAIANAIACGRTVDEINLLGVTFTQLGDTLLTIATQKSICCKPKS